MLASLTTQSWTRRACFWALPLLAFALLGVPKVSATVPESPQEKAKVIGQPVKLLVEPAAITLEGSRASRQVLITAQYADGKVRDLTHFAQLKMDNANVAEVENGGLILPKQNGSANLVVQAGGKTVNVPVTVKNLDKPQPISFRHDVIAALNVAGCNSGACHGTPTGKGGFRLSLRGYDPGEDYLQLTRDVLGRRTSRSHPEASLILLKPVGEVPHEGGIRFSHNHPAYKTILGWIKEGLQDDPANLPTLKELKIVPASRVLYSPARWQQLAVLAQFSDGSVKDVTRMTVFSSSENAVAEVNATGLVEFAQTGEVAILCRYLDKIESARLIYLEPKEGFVWDNPPEHNYVDKHAFAKLKMLNIQPAGVCSDSEFIRRAYLDLCAVLPSAQEVKDFLADKDQNKRTKLVDKLLDRPEYADFWTLKWMDVLRGSRTKLGLDGVKTYQKWIHDHIGKNTPFDQVVHDLLTAKGNTNDNGPANYYYATQSPEELAEVTAQLFFGVRMQCAKCHNHPFERWSQDDYYSTAAFFSQVKVKKLGGKNKGKQAQAVEIIMENQGSVKHLRTGQVMPPRFLGGFVPTIDKNQDRREVFAKWLTNKDNPFFARSVANRIWYHLLGRGIVDPVDDFRDSNPPANEELLDALAKDLVKNNFNVKHLIRTIMNSRTYQLSALSNKFNKDDNKYFSKAVTKLLTAEQLLDAICIATEVPEDFSGMPKGTRATQLPDGEFNNPFLKAFGQPARELACECERGGEASLAQALQLLNGKTVHDKLTHKNNRIGKLLAKKTPDQEILTELYLATISRLPNTKETMAVLNYVNQAADKRQAWEDIQWALLNTKEFMFRH